jgi:hypothetical protein
MRLEFRKEPAPVEALKIRHIHKSAGNQYLKKAIVREGLAASDAPREFELTGGREERRELNESNG